MSEISDTETVVLSNSTTEDSDEEVEERCPCCVMRENKNKIYKEKLIEVMENTQKKIINLSNKIEMYDYTQKNLSKILTKIKKDEINNKKEKNEETHKIIIKEINENILLEKKSNINRQKLINTRHLLQNLIINYENSDIDDSDNDSDIDDSDNDSDIDDNNNNDTNINISDID